MAKKLSVGKPDKNISYEMLPVSQLIINPYQRVLNVNFAKSIGSNFDLSQVGTITVSYRDGSYNVVDGQNRVYGAKVAGIAALMCIVHYNLSYEEEAKLFLSLNRNRKGLLRFDYFNAEVEAKEDRALAIIEIVKKYNFTISKGSGNNLIQALTTLNTIYNKYGPEHLDDVVRLIKLTWDGESASLNRVMLQGVSAFIDFYKSQFDEHTFIRQLRKIDPVKIIRESESDSANVTKAVKTVNALFRYYNRQLSTNRLENKHFTH